MQQKYDEIMQEVDARMATIDLNGKQIINDCKEMFCFLKKKLGEMRTFLQSHPFDEPETNKHNSYATTFLR